MSIFFINFMFNRHMTSWQSLKMEMIRLGSSTPGSIVKSYPTLTQICHEIEEGVKALRDSLRTVFHMGNSEERLQNRPGVAEDPVFAPIEYPLLLWWQVMLTQETGTFFNLFPSYSRSNAYYSSRVVIK
jgi:hypothetical protein